MRDTSKGKLFKIYMHIFPNGKVYIGITSLPVSRRWKNGSGYRKKQQLVYRAILKYGWDNIKHVILYEGLTKEEAEEKERELIKEFKANDPMHGYNAESGGSLNKRISDETKRKLRDINIGKRHKEESKRKLSISLKKAYAEGRKKMTAEHLQKMQDARKYDFEPWNKGKRVDRGRHIKQYTKDGKFIKEWINGREAQETLGIQHVYEVCMGKRASAGGFVWRYS